MYGIRVFEAWATRGARETRRLEVANPLGDGVSLLQRSAADAARLIGQGLLTGVPDMYRPSEWLPPDPPTYREPQVRFDDVEFTPEGHLFLKVRHGLHGEFDRALGQDSEIDLTKHTPVRDYRAMMMMPEHGSSGRLVVETISNRCPVTMLVRWLAFAEFQHNQTDWLRIKVQQLGDRARVRAMIRDAERVSAELTEVRPSMPGQRRVKRKLVSEVESHIERQSLIEEALSWLDPQASARADDGYILRIESIAGYEPEELDRAGLRFNDATIVVEDHEQKTKRINPESIRDKFTYPVSQDLPLDDDAWIARARSVVSGTLSEGTDIRL